MMIDAPHPVLAAVAQVRASVDNGSPIPDSVVKQVTTILGSPYNTLVPAVTVDEVASVAGLHWSSDERGASGISEIEQRKQHDAQVIGSALLHLLQDLRGRYLPTAATPSASAPAGAITSSILSVIASTCVTSLIQYLGKAEVIMAVYCATQATAESNNSNTAAASAVSKEDSLRRDAVERCHPLLQAAQALFLFTKFFQCTEQHVKELTALTKIFFTIVEQRSVTHSSGSFARATGAKSAVRQFLNQPANATLNAIMYLVTMSVCNSLSCWSSLRSTGTNCRVQVNALLSSPTLLIFVEEWLHDLERVAFSTGAGGGFSVTAITSTSGAAAASAAAGASLRATSLSRGRLAVPSTPSLAPVTPPVGGLLAAAPTGRATGGPASSASHPPVALQQQQQQSQPQSVMLAYASLIQLALGAALIYRNDTDKGSDLVVAAAVGSGSTRVNRSLSRGGSVFKRMVQLCPVETSLCISMPCVAEVSFVFLSWLLDEALPSMHHIAELDLNSCQEFLDQQREEELAALQSGGHIAPSTSYLSVQPMGRTNPMLENNNNNGAVVVSRGFSSEVAHLLRALSFYLGHLDVASVLEEASSSGDVAAGAGDSAAVFFTFKNAFAHMRSLFELQRQDGAWEAFVLKAVSSFVLLATTLVRHAPTLHRVLTLLADSQLDCPELQLGSLMAQVRECLRLSTSSTSRSTLLATGGDGPSAALHRGSSSRHSSKAFARKQQDRFVESVTGLFEALVREVQKFSRSGSTVALSSPTSPLSQQLVTNCVSLDAVLAMTQSPVLVPRTLLRVLSLLGQVVSHSPQEAARVWSYLYDTTGLLKPPSSASSAQSFSSTSGSSRIAGRSAAPQADSDVFRSLLGHVQHERHVGEYAVTTGTLQLIFSLLSAMGDVEASGAPQGVVSSEHFNSVAAVLKFVAEDVASGICRRTFANVEEEAIVTSLAYGVLAIGASLSFKSLTNGDVQQPAARVSEWQSQADDAGSHSSNPVSTAVQLPLSLLTASFKAPNDVLGDLIELLTAYANAGVTQTLSSPDATTLRHATHLLHAILCSLSQSTMSPATVSSSSSGGGGGNFSLDARTKCSVELAVALLKLVAFSDDPCVAHKCIAMIGLLPQALLTDAARFLMVRIEIGSKLLEAFRTILDPRTLNTSELRDFRRHCGGSELLKLDEPFAAMCAVPGFERKTKSLFLDLLIRIAPQPHPSILSWLVGCTVLRLPHQAAGASGGLDTDQRRDEALLAIVLGANDEGLAAECPHLHVKYVRLLYLIRNNRGISKSPAIQEALSSRGADAYLSRVLQCGSVEESTESICCYGLCLKTIALEVYSASFCGHASGPAMMNGGKPPPAAGSSAARRVARLLGRLLGSSNAALTPNGRTQQHVNPLSAGAANMSLYTSLAAHSATRYLADDGAAGVDGQAPVAPTTPFAEWPAAVLRSLETFPCLPVPPGGLSQFVRVAVDGTPQYAIEGLHRAFTALVQQEVNDGLLKVDAVSDAVRERLLPFVDANRCLSAYAAALVFVEGWTALVEVAASLSAPSSASSGSSNGDASSTSRGTVLLDDGHAVADSAAAVIHNALSVEELLRLLLQIMDAMELTTNFTVAAQEQISAPLSRTALALIAKLRRVAESLAATKSGVAAVWNKTVVQSTLGAMLNALCLVGPRSAAVRADLYNAILMFLQLPQLPLDPIMLLRAHSQVFQLVLTDMNDGSLPVLQLASLHFLRTLLRVSPQLLDLFCVAQNGLGCAPALSQFSASALSVLDEVVTQHICYGGQNNAAAAPAQSFQTNPLVIYLVQAVLDVLLLLSQHHADAVYRSNAFAICNRMEVWKIGTRLTLDLMSTLSSGNSQGSRSAQVASAAHAQAVGYPLLNRLLIGVVRWYNVSLRCLSQNDDAVFTMADFVNSAQLLMQLSLSPGVVGVSASLTSSPLTSELLVQAASGGFVGNAAAGSNAASPQTDDATGRATLSLLYETSELLFNFSTTHAVAQQCMPLIETFAVPALLHELMRDPALSAAVQQDSSRSSPLLGTVRTVRNLVMFLASVLHACTAVTTTPKSAVYDGPVLVTLHANVSNALCGVCKADAAVKHSGREATHVRLALLESLDALTLMLSTLMRLSSSGRAASVNPSPTLRSSVHAAAADTVQRVLPTARKASITQFSQVSTATALRPALSAATTFHELTSGFIPIASPEAAVANAIVRGAQEELQLHESSLICQCEVHLSNLLSATRSTQ